MSVVFCFTFRLKTLYRNCTDKSLFTISMVNENTGLYALIEHCTATDECTPKGDINYMTLPVAGTI